LIIIFLVSNADKARAEGIAKAYVQHLEEYSKFKGGEIRVIKAVAEKGKNNWALSLQFQCKLEVQVVEVALKLKDWVVVHDSVDIKRMGAIGPGIKKK
jgi:hypothetical protein